MKEAAMVKTLAKAWWVVALRGVLGILFGIGAFIWPGITLLVLITFFGVYMFVDGAIALWQAIQFRHDRERWPMLLLEAVLGLAVGAITFFAPGVVAVAWVYWIAAWAIITGILEIVLAIRLRKVIEGEVFVILTGILSIALGAALFLMPLAGLVAWVWLIGAYSIVFGVLLLGLALRLRKIASAPYAGVSQTGGV
jgi:uncharacterized membrane protein HdeD (DUF308 family)